MRLLGTSGLVLVCILLLGGSVLPSDGSLAAYSETRSFRDALEGRSMEEAISGPVDKDTSSYGDRTSGSGANSSPSSGSNSYNTGSGGSMMVSIPANGNLNGAAMMNGVQQQTEQQQQPESAQKSYGSGKSQSGVGDSELEREAGPVEPMQQMMQKRQKPSERLMSRVPKPAMMMPASQTPRNGRLQQQQQETTDYNTKSNEAGFGDEQGKQAMGDEMSTKQSYGGNKSDGEEQQRGGSNYGSGDEQQQTGAGEQQVMNGGADEPQQQAKNYGPEDQQVAAKQRAMAAMLMSMNNGMKYSRSAASMGMMANDNMGMQQPMYGNKRPSSSMAAQNMITSLANKAAYMSQQQSRRQMAPPMMMAMNGANSYGPNQRGQDKNEAAMSGLLTAMMMNGNGMRGMRRANQRRAEKKMSPAMVNAMLNKMLGSARDESSTEPGSSQGYSKPSTEMLANMMMPQMVGGALAGMSAGKREQYKRAMMAAISMSSNQDQSSGGNSYGGQQQQQMSTGDEATKANTMTTSAYGNQMTSTMSPIAMMMSMMNNQRATSSYEKPDQQQQQQQMLMMDQQKMKMNGYGGDEMQQKEQQEQMKQPMNSYGQENQMMITQAPQMMMMKMGYGNKQMGSYTPTPSTMPMMPTNKMYGGFGGEGKKEGQNKMNGGSSYGSMDEKEQQKEYGNDSTMLPSPIGTKSMETSTERGGSYQAGSQMSMQMNAKSLASMPMNGFNQAYNQGRSRNSDNASQMSDKQAYPQSTSTGKSSTYANSDYGSSTMMPRPMMSSSKGYGDEQQKQDEQKQQDEYGSAPMGQAEPFAFDYKIEDDYGNGQYRKEESDKNGVVRGSYGYTDVSGIYRHVEYVADENGFRANIKSNEPGLSSEPSTSGGKQAMPNDNSNGISQMAASPAMVENGLMGGQQQQQTLVQPATGQSQMNENEEK